MCCEYTIPWFVTHFCSKFVVASNIAEIIAYTIPKLSIFLFGAFLIVKRIADRNVNPVDSNTTAKFVTKNSSRKINVSITPKGVFKLWYCVALDTPILSIAVAYIYTDKNQNNPLTINIIVIEIDTVSLHIPVI